MTDLMFIYYISPLNPDYILCDLCEAQSKSSEVLLSVRSSDVFERYRNQINSKLNIGQDLHLEFGDPKKLNAIQVINPEKKPSYVIKTPIQTKKA